MNQDPHQSDWRKRLTDQQAPMDIDQFWAHLEPNLPPQRRRRPVWWWLFPIGLMAGAALYWWATGDQTTEKSMVSGMVQTDDPSRSDGETLAIEEGPTAMHDKPEDSRASDPVAGSVQQPLAEVEPMDMGGRVKDRVPGSSGNRDSDPVQVRPSEDRPVERETVRLKAEPVDEGAFGQSRAEAIGSPDEPAPTGQEAISVQPYDLRVTDRFAEAEIRFLDRNQIPLPGSALAPSSGPSQPAWELALAISGGPGIGIRSLVATDDARKGWVDERHRTERMLESWQVRIMAELRTPAGVYLEAGGQWTRQNERFDWSADSVSWVWGPAEGFLVDGQGGTQPWQDTAWSAYRLHREVRHYNRISTLELPVGLGYMFHKGPWTLQGGGGVLVNIRQISSGRSLHPQGRPAYWENEALLALRPRIGLGYYGQLRIGRSLGTGLDIFLQPTWSAYPADRSSGQGISLTYDHIHVQAGIRWRLSNR